MMTNGKMSKSLAEFYEDQIAFQELVVKKFGYGCEVKSIPEDNIEVAKYHLLGLTEEMGELVKSDKRWKNFRNTHFDKDNKLEEISDCFVCLMNVAMFSGTSPEELVDALSKKIQDNFNRIQGA